MRSHQLERGAGNQLELPPPHGITSKDECQLPKMEVASPLEFVFFAVHDRLDLLPSLPKQTDLLMDQQGNNFSEDDPPHV